MSLPRRHPIDNSSWSHPSLFQTPVQDAALDADPKLVLVQDPSKTWNPSPSSYSEAQSGPPLSHAEKQKLVAYYQPVVETTYDNQEMTLLMVVFMSRGNVDEIQKRIQRRVYEESGSVIGRQSDTELIITMNNVYSGYAKDLPENYVSRSVLMKHVKVQVDKLDDTVVEAVLPIIIDNIQGLTGVIKKFNEPVGQVMPQPLFTSISGTREYRQVTDVLTPAFSSLN